MGNFSRAEVLASINERVARHESVILGAASNGLVAQAAAAVGIDILMVYNIGRFRMDGHGSMLGYLPYGDANSITVELASRILPVAGDIPVIAGVAAADPYRRMPSLIDHLQSLGISGVTNTPTAGVYDGSFRKIIEAQRLGYAREIELMRLCRAKDVFSVAYAFTPEDAHAMAEAGADMVAAHLGLTGGSGADAPKALDEACALANRICEAALKGRDDVLLLAHGGPLENAAAVQRVFACTPVIGYIGGSAFDRIPVDAAIRTTVAEFKRLRTSGQTQLT